MKKKDDLPDKFDNFYKGLMTYGASSLKAVGCCRHVGRILDRRRLSGLPILQPTTSDQRINLKTTKTLGSTMPPSLLTLADEVIE